MWVFPDYMDDILLRHSRTCKQKGSLPLSPGKPGRKRKACHGCSRGRLACDGDLPCESCLLKGLQCSYTNAQQHKELSFASCDGIASESQSPYPMVRSPYDFHHMLAGPCARISGSADQLLRCTWVESDQFIDSWPSIFHAFSSDPLCGLDEEANMAQTIDRLIEHIEKAPVPHSGNTQLKAKARSFFSKENLVRFVNSFFENAYNSVPCIHKASFNINTSSLHLGLNAKAAEEYFDISEYSIFEGIEFRRLVYEEIHPRLTSGTIQLIQAALLTIMLQGSKNQLEMTNLQGYLYKETLVRFVIILLCAAIS
ncbi:hypothetical protein BDV59DRAFT_196337 [Aspergillus ambiguus]|uniref:Zn(II)2Cys6 transcription factor domain-containing protein n=1 Tax=Aspergillus ambiguus TaxID=176160 RepID=UPI003CCCECF8